MYIANAPNQNDSDNDLFLKAMGGWSIYKFEHDPQSGGVFLFDNYAALVGPGELKPIIEKILMAFEFYGQEAYDEYNAKRLEILVKRQSEGQVSSTRKFKAKPPDSGYVYLMHSEMTNLYKIGVSTDPNKRLKQIILATGDESITLVHVISCNYMHKTEGAMHDRYAEYRKSGEWFNLPPFVIQHICSLERS